MLSAGTEPTGEPLEEPGVRQRTKTPACEQLAEADSSVLGEAPGGKWFKMRSSPPLWGEHSAEPPPGWDPQVPPWHGRLCGPLPPQKDIKIRWYNCVVQSGDHFGPEVHCFPLIFKGGKPCSWAHKHEALETAHRAAGRAHSTRHEGQRPRPTALFTMRKGPDRLGDWGPHVASQERVLQPRPRPPAPATHRAVCPLTFMVVKFLTRSNSNTISM